MEEKGQELERGEPTPFPESFTDTKACDEYFFGYVEKAAKRIAEKKGIIDKEKIAGISIQLNRTYTKYPEVALSRIRDVLEEAEDEKKE